MSNYPPQLQTTPGKPPGRRTLIIVLTVTGTALALILFCVWAMFNALGQARRAARVTANIQHVEAIGKALALYARNNGGAMPEVNTGWETRLNLGTAVFQSPGDQSGLPAYIYVPGYNVNGLQRGSLTGAEIVLYQNPDIDAARYPVLFVDGRTTLLTKDELKKMVTGTSKPVYR